MSNGKLLTGLPIAVDHWKLPKSHEKHKTYLYFLTHMHTDHTRGLTSTWSETIYTSSLNRDLATTMLKVKPALIIPLDIGVGYSLSLPPEHGSVEGKHITVTPLDANHIRGSVMFLFEGSFGRILYTGDFRWCDSMMQNPSLKGLAENKNLDLLYVDNTFEEEGTEFPTREECLAEVLRIVKKYQYHRIIFGCQTIGKEDALLSAARYRNEKIYIPENTMIIYRALGLPEELFTTNQNDSLLWFEHLRKINQFNLKQKNLEMPTIAITLTASYLLSKQPKAIDDDMIISVPYSNHCSASELTKCLEFLQPILVERIVQSPSKKPASSVIINYVNNKTADMTSDSSNDSMDPALFKSQMPERFFSPASQPEAPIEQITSSQEKDIESFMEISSMTSPSQPDAALNDVMEQAGNVIASITEDLDRTDGKCIYSDSFIDKLLSLAKIYQPATGITSNMSFV